MSRAFDSAEGEFAGEDRFKDRHDAGKRLAAQLQHYDARPDTLILALPRGGVPVGFEIARELHAPLDVLLVRKLGVPWQEELAMGAIASGDVMFLDEGLINNLGVSEQAVQEVIAREEQELARREIEFRGKTPPPVVRDRTVILVDDGLATGATMRAAARALRKQDPQKLIVAVPVAAAETCNAMLDEVDEIVCAVTPEPFYAVGLWYIDFTQTSDSEVRELLTRARDRYEYWASQNKNSASGNLPVRA